jgi:xylulokinase
MLLAIDIGTSSAKAITMNPQTAKIIAVAAAEYPVRKPLPDRAEQDPADWWSAVIEVVRKVSADVQISAIGLTGQMHGTVLLDAAHQPIQHAIIWADQRSAATVEAMPDRTTVTGTRPAAGFMASTLAWSRDYAPEVLDRAQHALLPKDYVRLKLTGELATDISDAASTALFDVRAGDWSDEVIRALGLPRAIFPQVLGSAQIAGRLTSTAADALGLPAGIPVVAGCADQPAQAIANGLTRPGIASVTIGTGGQIFVPLSLKKDGELPTDPRLHVFNHAVPGAVYALGAILAAGLALRWLRNLTAAPDFETLSIEAEQAAAGANGLLFLPYLAGERTPHMDPRARGAFIGLSDYHTRGHLARAVMEGVAYALRQTLEIATGLGAPVKTLIAAGGGMESDVWRGIVADVLDLPLQRTLQAEQTCLGAAVLAGVGSGDYATIIEGSMAVTQYSTLTLPHHQAVYNDRYAQFVTLYPTLRDDMHRLSG